ncbi:MAG: E3 ubiquitin-protein ligase synoviolin [Thelocarpon impressellum]|nr:MAG: E3 ubiquitin-protein ligase synoviolin [Thelocarpon impressellum]
MRLAAYAGTSTVLATAVIIRAFHRRPNFYSASVYLAQSNACVMILTNLILLIVCFGMVGLQRLLYGPLRPIEIEQLYEKAWFAITETCLAMTIFRDEVGGWFLVMFVALLMGKVWGWIGDGRVEVLEQQPPANPRLFHARLTVSLLLSLLFDLSLLRYAVHTVLLMARPNMMVMFAFEFAILAISSSSTTVRYAISLTEAVVIKQQTRAKLEERRQELREAREQERRLNDESAPVDDGELDVDEMDIDVPGWEEKGQWVFYLELVTDFFKLVVYLSFFFILLAFYGLPIHIMRDVFLTLRSFIKRITDFLRYRRATQDMNQRYPDASPEEVVREEVCIICREEMQPWPPNNQAPNANAPAAPAAGNGHAVTARVDERSRAKKLPCGHILHFGCLRSWLERQQICPTCRRPVMVTDRITVGTTPPQAGNPGINVVGEGGQRGEAPRPGVPQAGPGPLAHEANNRARVFNLGPLRFGFGVGQHEFMQNLAHQIHNGRVAEPLPDGLQGLGANAGAQQIGLGFGFGRPQGLANQPAPAQPGSPGSASFQAQIHRLELQIANEVNRLRASVEQLRVIQALQNELPCLRPSFARTWFRVRLTLRYLTCRQWGPATLNFRPT